MNLEQKIGQMLVFGWSGSTRDQQVSVNEHARELVEDMQVGGVLLLSRNVADDLRTTVGTINRLQSMSRFPLFVNADHEGGVVARITNGITWFASNMALGATGEPRLAYKAAATMAKELTAVGINLNFAPCVDVNNNPDNPIIGTRSFGESPVMVARFGRQAVRGYQDHGMIACAKHFPGHGDTAQDSHVCIPVVSAPLKQMKRFELKPFCAAIRAGVSCVMTNHVLFPALDPENPATLSPRILNRLLREEMGFKGVIVADCLEMRSITDNWDAGEAAVMAVEAGVDLVVAAHTLSAQRKIRTALIDAVKQGRISESRIDESVARILGLKQSYELEERRYSNPEFLTGLLLQPRHLELKQHIARRAVTLVRNEDGLIPLKPKADERILVVGAIDAVGGLAHCVGDHHGNTRALRLAGLSEAGFKSGMAAAEESDYVIVPTFLQCPVEDRNLAVKLVRALVAKNRKPIVVAVKEPYDLRHFPEVRTYICAYGLRGGTFPAVAELIFGLIEPTGKLPVTIPLE